MSELVSVEISKAQGSTAPLSLSLFPPQLIVLLPVEFNGRGFSLNLCVLWYRPSQPSQLEKGRAKMMRVS